MLVCSLSKLEVKYLLVLINNIDSFNYCLSAAINFCHHFLLNFAS